MNASVRSSAESMRSCFSKPVQKVGVAHGSVIKHGALGQMHSIVGETKNSCCEGLDWQCCEQFSMFKMIDS